MILKATVREVILSINSDPSAWKPKRGMFKWSGISNNNVQVLDYGNPKVISTIELHIDGLRVQLSWFDAYYLEKAVQAWYKDVPIEQF